MNIRIGFGIDFHQLVTDREFWLGGVLIPHSKGALGHSDADVLLHAICDAMLGAACLGDIGVHFPDTDETLKNIDSKILLKQSFELIKKEGYKLSSKAAGLLNNIMTDLYTKRDKYFGNARTVRKIILEIIKNQNLRISNIPVIERKKGQFNNILPEDFSTVGGIQEAEIIIKKTIGFRSGDK